MSGEEAGDQPFDFIQESKEFTDNHFVTSIEFITNEPGFKAHLKIVTLEHTVIDLIWSATGYINIAKA